MRPIQVVYCSYSVNTNYYEKYVRILKKNIPKLLIHSCTNKHNAHADGQKVSKSMNI